MLICILMNVGSTENQLWREEAQGGVRQTGPQSGLYIFIFIFLRPNRDQAEFAPPPKKAQLAS